MRFRPGFIALDERDLPSAVVNTIFLGSAPGETQSGLLVVQMDDGTGDLYRGAYDSSLGVWVPDMTVPADSGYISTVIPVGGVPPGGSAPVTTAMPPFVLPPGIIPPSGATPQDREEVLKDLYSRMLIDLHGRYWECQALMQQMQDAYDRFRTADGLWNAVRGMNDADRVMAAFKVYSDALEALDAAVDKYNEAARQYNALYTEFNAVKNALINEGFGLPLGSSPPPPTDNFSTINRNGLLNVPNWFIDNAR